MAYHRGDILLVPFPFSDLSTTKVRPAVVISGTRYHATQPDILLAAITSKVSAAVTSLDYVLSDWLEAGLRYPSAFKPVFFTLDPARIIYPVGRLSATDLKEIDNRLRIALEI